MGLNRIYDTIQSIPLPVNRIGKTSLDFLVWNYKIPQIFRLYTINLEYPKNIHSIPKLSNK